MRLLDSVCQEVEEQNTKFTVRVDGLDHQRDRLDRVRRMRARSLLHGAPLALQLFVIETEPRPMFSRQGQPYLRQFAVDVRIRVRNEVHETLDNVLLPIGRGDRLEGIREDQVNQHVPLCCVGAFWQIEYETAKCVGVLE